MSGKPRLDDILKYTPTNMADFVSTNYDRADVDLKIMIPEAVQTLDPVHQYKTALVSFSCEGTKYNFLDENARYYDLMRLVASPSVPDDLTGSLVVPHLTTLWCDSAFLPHYSAKGDVAFTEYVYKIADEDISRAGVDTTEYSSFADDVMHGFTAIDLAIKAGKNEVAKAMMSHFMVSMPLYNMNSSWVRDWTEGAKSLADVLSLTSNPAESHSKLFVSSLFSNVEIFRWIIEQRHDASKPVMSVEEATDICSGTDFLAQTSRFLSGLDAVAEEIKFVFRSLGSELRDADFFDSSSLGEAGGAGCSVVPAHVPPHVELAGVDATEF